MTLPSGASISVSSLTVQSALQTFPVSSLGGFNANVSTSVPSLAVATDAIGQTVLMGFLDPRQASFKSLSATSTAIALLYFSLGGSTLPQGNTRALLQLIASDASVAELASVIGARIANDPSALFNADPQIASALAAAQSSIASLRSPRQLPVIEKPATASILSIQPTGQQSGVEVNQDATTNAAIPINYYRRRCKLFVYETQTVTNGVTDTFANAKLKTGPIDFPAVENLGVTSSLKDLFTGSAPFSPVTLPAIPLSLDGSSDQTTYEIVVLGSAFVALEPAFFHTPRYANELATWQSVSNSLFNHTFLIDLVFSVFLEMLGLRNILASEAAIEAAADAVAAIQDAAFQNALLEARNGNYSQALIDCLTDAVNSDLVSSKFKQILAGIVGTAEARALQAAQQTALQSAFKVAGLLINKILTAAGLLLTAGDIGKVCYDNFNADQGSLWTGLLVKQILTLNPQTSTVAPGATVTFTVKPPAGITEKVVYDWTQTSAYGTLSASDGTVGNSIETSSTVVNFISTGSDSATVTITVIGYLVDTSGTKTELGKAQANVAFKAQTGTNIKPGIALSVFAAEPIPQDYASVVGFFTFKPEANLPANAVYQAVSATFGGAYSPSFVQGDIAHPPSQVNTSDYWVGTGQGDGENIKQYPNSQGCYNLGGGVVGMAVTSEYYDYNGIPGGGTVNYPTLAAAQEVIQAYMQVDTVIQVYIPPA